VRSVCYHNFDADTPVSEPIEIRLFNPRLMPGGELYVLAASVSGSGLIQYGMTNNGCGVACSLSNLQPKGIFPKKAVSGWQVEVIEAAASGLYDVVKVR
jgi:hypothetical protein